jgi:hypothetical protein
MHDGGLNTCDIFYCTKYGNKQKFLCVRWGSGPCIIPEMQRSGRKTSHSSPSSFEVRMDVTIPLPALFWVYMQRVVVISYRNFGITYRPHLQGSQETRKGSADLIHMVVEAWNNACRTPPLAATLIPSLTNIIASLVSVPYRNKCFCQK